MASLPGSSTWFSAPSSGGGREDRDPVSPTHQAMNHWGKGALPKGYWVAKEGSWMLNAHLSRQRPFAACRNFLLRSLQYSEME